MKTLDEFMSAAADHDVTFRVDRTEEGLEFAVGYPHEMSPEWKTRLQVWVAAHCEELAEALEAMAMAVGGGRTGISIITPEKVGPLQ